MVIEYFEIERSVKGNIYIKVGIFNPKTGKHFHKNVYQSDIIDIAMKSNNKKGD